MAREPEQMPTYMYTVYYSALFLGPPNVNIAQEVREGLESEIT